MYQKQIFERTLLAMISVNINMTDVKMKNKAITSSFQILRHWFQYKVPKWLSVINELQKYASIQNNIRPGNYSYYASQLENDFVRDNLTILLEYGVPRTAIQKISKYIREDLSEDEVNFAVESIVTRHENVFSTYELGKFNQFMHTDMTT
jgi:hypothetical protein